MDGEIGNFTKVWLTAALSGCYCYALSITTQKGLLRLLLILPVAAFFAAAPYALVTCTLGGPTWFFLTWLGVSKLLLFSFGAGPLSTPSQQLSLPQFVCALLLPIKIRKPDPNPKTAHGGARARSWGLFGVKLVGLICVFRGYDHRERIPYWGMLGLYCCHVYLSLELALFVGGALARGSLGLELAPQVNRPYLCSSLQDFWGKRWNLMVSDILRQTVHNPIRSITSPYIGRKPSILVAVFASFLISGLMHEWIFHILTRVSPSWEVTCFFILHGVCLDLEIVIKMAVSNSCRLHRTISWSLTVGFVTLTAFWLFFPPLLRSKFHEKAIVEYAVMGSFLRTNVMYFFWH
ncbi:hypothetical protein V2J09_011620 [Rumex salicifolius]